MKNKREMNCLIKRKWEGDVTNNNECEIKTYPSKKGGERNRQRGKERNRESNHKNKDEKNHQNDNQNAYRCVETFVLVLLDQFIDLPCVTFHP